MRNWTLAALLLPALAAPAAADPVSILTPPEYNPGGTFAVGVYLPEIGALGGYTLDVVFTTAVPVTGLLSVAPPAPPGDYVSPNTANFTATRTAAGFEYRVTLSDAIDGPPFANVRAGETDHVADLMVTTSADLRGPITVSIDPNTFSVAAFDDTFVDRPGPSVIAQGDPVVSEPTPAPAPPGLVCAAVAGLAFGGRRVLRPRAAGRA